MPSVVTDTCPVSVSIPLPANTIESVVNASVPVTSALVTVPIPANWIPPVIKVRVPVSVSVPDPAKEMLKVVKANAPVSVSSPLPANVMLPSVAVKEPDIVSVPEPAKLIPPVVKASVPDTPLPLVTVTRESSNHPANGGTSENHWVITRSLSNHPVGLVAIDYPNQVNAAHTRVVPTVIAAAGFGRVVVSPVVLLPCRIGAVPASCPPVRAVPPFSVGTVVAVIIIAT